MSVNVANIYGTASNVDRGQSLTNSPTNVNDNNTTTWAGCSCFNTIANYDSDIIVSFRASNLTQLVILNIVAYADPFPDAGAASGATGTVYLLVNGSWVSIGTLPSLTTSTPSKQTTTFNGSWANVTAVKVTITGYVNYNSASPPLVGSYSYIYEIYAYGYAYNDSTIRVETTAGVFALAKDFTLSGPVHFNTSHGIGSFVLVATTDALASPVRVSTFGGVMAVAKYV